MQRLAQAQQAKIDFDDEGCIVLAEALHADALAADHHAIAADAVVLAVMSQCNCDRRAKAHGRNTVLGEHG